MKGRHNMERERFGDGVAVLCFNLHVECMLYRYIANLGHGLQPTHDPENVGVFFRSVQEISVSIAHRGF